jgi:hypothetical protein
MPIRSGQRGGPGFLAAPATGWTPRTSPNQEAPLGGWTPQKKQAIGRPFRSQNFTTRAYKIAGITRDSTGAPLGNVTVQLFRTQDDFFVEEKISDGSGNFSFDATPVAHYLVAYKAGAPDVAGTTVNTLVGAEF